MTLYRESEEVRGRSERNRSGTRMFDETIKFSLFDSENGWMKTSVVEMAAGMKLWRVHSTGHDIELSERRFATFLMPLKGRLDVETRTGTFSALPGDAVAFSPNWRRTKVSSAGSEPYEALVLLVPWDDLAPRTIDQKTGTAPIEVSAVGHSEAGAGLKAYMTFLDTEMSRASSKLSRPGLIEGVSAVARELFGELVDERSAPDDPKARRVSAGAAHVRRAEGLIRSNFEGSFSIAELARSLGVSIRSLQLAFHEHRGYGPREALNLVRLAEVHRRLSAGNQYKTVSAIALDCGFTHLGRFSAAYRKVYGELPSETAQSRWIRR